MTFRDPLYIKRPAARVPQQPTPTANLNVGTLATAAASTYFLNDTGITVKARRVQQPDQPNGMIQLLTFVAPALPKNNYDWPNPKIVKPIPARWNTSFCMNPALIPQPAVTPPSVHSHPAQPRTAGRMLGRS